MGTSHAYTAICKSDGVNPEVLTRAKIAIEISIFDLLEESQVCSIAQMNWYALDLLSVCIWEVLVFWWFFGVGTFDFHYKMEK